MTDLDRASGHPRSTASIAGHPVHPMLIPFPIACFVLTFGADLMYGATTDPFFATASIWLLGIGLVFAALAAIAGLTDYIGDQRIRAIGDATKHMIANVTAVVLEAVNLFLRLGDRGAIANTGTIISGVVVLILLYSGWKGWELVYRHGVGTRPRSDGDVA
jgi:uncharacterized membrane protein